MISGRYPHLLPKLCSFQITGTACSGNKIYSAGILCTQSRVRRETLSEAGLLQCSMQGCAIIRQDANRGTPDNRASFERALC